MAERYALNDRSLGTKMNIARNHIVIGNDRKFNAIVKYCKKKKCFILASTFVFNNMYIHIEADYKLNLGLTHLKKKAV